jgi:tetratricopeptide (TPR) repeat protein
MPRYLSSDVAHSAATNHRIPRDGQAASAGDAPPERPEAAPELMLHRDDPGADDVERERNRAVAVVKQALGGNAAAREALGTVLAPLETALRRDPDDRIAAEAKGYALTLQGRRAEALAAFEALLVKAPQQELAVIGAGAVAEALGQTETAERHWRRAVALSPSEPGYRGHLTRMLLKREAWEEARESCQIWMRLDPMSAEARAALVQCLLATGNKTEARAEFARLEALAPANLRELQIRFEKKLR